MGWVNPREPNLADFLEVLVTSGLNNLRSKAWFSEKGGGSIKRIRAKARVLHFSLIQAFVVAGVNERKWIFGEVESPSTTKHVK